MGKGFPYKRLGKYINQSQLKNKKSENIDVYSVTNTNGFKRSIDFFKKEVFSKNTSSYKIVNKGNFAYNPSRINVGSIDFLKDKDQVLVSPLYIVFEVGNEIYREYLLKYLKSPIGLAQIRHNAQGAVRESLKYKGLENIKIPLPSLDNQIRITTLLSKVESLITKRKKSITDLDEMLKSTFLNMFGNPVRNNMGWDESIIEKCCEKIIDCPHKTPVYSDTETGFYCIRSSDIVDGYLNLKNTKQVDVDVFHDRIKRIKPQKNDILYCREGGRLGNAARILTNDEICLGQRIMLFRNHKDCESQFLWALFESSQFKQKIDSLVGGGGAPRVNIKDLKKITIIKPARKFQTQFATIVEKVESLKAKYQNSLNDLETLYGALSQKAFKGELDLSRIPITVELKPKDITTGVPQVGEPVLTVQDRPDKALETREQTLLHLFNRFISGAKNGALFLDDFWLEAEEKLMDFMDEDAPPLGVADYDRVRDWLFDMLTQGKVAQVFNEQENRMEIRSVS